MTGSTSCLTPVSALHYPFQDRSGSRRAPARDASAPRPEIAADPAAGRAARRIVQATAILAALAGLTVLAGWTLGLNAPGFVRLAGARAGWYGTGVAMMMIGSSALLWRSALALQAIENEHSRTLRVLRHSEERWRLLSRELLDIEQAERRNITRELHDRLGPNLAVLNIMLEMAHRELPPESQGLRQRLREAQDIVSETAEHARDIMAALDPPLLHMHGIVAALKEYAATVMRRFGVTVEVSSADAMLAEGPAIVATAIFRIVQEAVVNAAKHAHAHRIEIQVDATGRDVGVAVVDDGSGFDPDTVKPHSRGLALMQDRAAAVGADVQVRSQVGAGTRVLLTWKRP
jgi:signal transduction histidine kinase